MYVWFRALRIEELDLRDIILWNIFSPEMCINIVAVVYFTMSDACVAAVVLNVVYCVNNDCPFAGRSKLQLIAITSMLCR